MSIKKSLGCKKQKLPKDSWSVRNFCKELEVFHGNLVEDPSRKAPQKTKSELGSPRQLLFSPRAGSRILASSACSHIFFIIFFLPECLLFFWGSMHKVTRAQTSNTLLRHSKTTQGSESLFWTPTRQHLWGEPGLTMSGSGTWLCSGAKLVWLTC